MKKAEAIFIEMEEYQESESYRLSEVELAMNGIYTAMVRVNPNDELLQAAKFPLMIKRLDYVGKSNYSGLVSPLDVDLNETFKVPADFSAGYWINIASVIHLLTSNSNDLSPNTGYLKPFSGPEDDELLEIKAELILPSSKVLTPAR